MIFNELENWPHLRSNSQTLCTGLPNRRVIWRKHIFTVSMALLYLFGTVCWTIGVDISLCKVQFDCLCCFLISFWGAEIFFIWPCCFKPFLTFACFWISFWNFLEQLPSTLVFRLLSHFSCFLLTYKILWGPGEV